MIASIRIARAKHVRIHVSGDFYDAGYIRKWIRIAKTCSSTKFFTYTRSWRRKRLLSAFGEFKQLKNVFLWWSADRDTHRNNGRPPRWRGVRVAFMVTEYDERVPAYADLVFRHKRYRVEKYRDGRLICPTEQGVKRDWKLTCTDCGLCYQNRNVPKRTGEPQLVQLK